MSAEEGGLRGLYWGGVLNSINLPIIGKYLSPNNIEIRFQHNLIGQSEIQTTNQLIWPWKIHKLQLRTFHPQATILAFSNLDLYNMYITELFLIVLIYIDLAITYLFLLE